MPVYVETPVHVLRVLATAVAVPISHLNPPYRSTSGYHCLSSLRICRIRSEDAGSIHAWHIRTDGCCHPAIGSSADLEECAVVCVESVLLSMDAAIGCEVLDGVIACLCPERRLVAALQRQTQGLSLRM